MSARDFSLKLSSLKGRTLFTFHALGDIDAVASAVALSKLVSNSSVACVDGVSAHTRHVLERAGVPVPRQLSAGDLESFDNLVLCDVSSSDLLGGFDAAVEAFKGKLLVVDHHSHGSRLSVDASLIDSSKSSSCELAFDIYRALGRKPSESVAVLLLCGILHDSAFFKSANKGTFKCFDELLALTSLDYRQLLVLAARHDDVGLRGARLKAVARHVALQSGQFIVCYSLSSSFELDCASRLVGCGADVAFVANPGRGVISGVKSESLAGLNIGRVMEKAGVVMNGSGGGHENVGGAKGKPELCEKALDACVREAFKALGVTGSRLPAQLRQSRVG